MWKHNVIFKKNFKLYIYKNFCAVYFRFYLETFFNSLILKTFKNRTYILFTEIYGLIKLLNKLLEIMKIRNLLIMVTLVISFTASAKREVPAEVPAIIYGGVIYSVPHFGFENGSKQNGGFVKATNEKSNEVMWVKRIYKIWYNPFKEQDVQDIFITNMHLSSDNKYLVIINERNEKYSLNIGTKKVKKL